MVAPTDDGHVVPEYESESSLLRRILIVDDDTDAAEALGELLRDCGHEVATAHDGPQALDRARLQRPDVVLLDIGMPEMDGYEVAKRIREELGLDDALLVALTGYGEDRHRRLAQMEADHISEVLRLTAGNKSRAARILGISRQGLIEKLRRLRLIDHASRQVS